MSAESLPEHIRQPHLRPVQPFPMKKDGKQYIALRDPAMLSDQTMVVPPQTLPVLQLFQGDRSIDQIAEQVNGDVNQFIELAKGLDKIGLLWGPTFEQLEAQLMDKVRTRGSIETKAAIPLGRDETTCRKAIENYFEGSEDPEVEGSVVGIVAPHLDYERGWPNYAAAYYCLKDCEPPDRFVILGTNHYGIGDGVVLTEFGFVSPFGISPADSAVTRTLLEMLGERITVDQLDHVTEHSIQLHIPWLQYCCGEVPIIAALIPDPLTPLIKEDKARATTDEFIASLRESLQEVGGRTMFIASSDLSHVGPQFGEPRAVDDKRRFDVERHDRDMLTKFLTGDKEEFLSAFRWNKNPTRWCSIGNMAAILELAKPESLELIDYRQTSDENGLVMVSSAAVALMNA